MRKIYAFLVSCVVLCACTDETITYIYPTPTDPPQQEITLALSSADPHYKTTDDLNGLGKFKSHGGELTVQVKTNSKNWRSDAGGADWLTLTANKLDQLHIAAAPNVSTAARKAVIKVYAGEGDKAREATISIDQNAFGTAEISASETSVELPACGDTTTEITIDCKADEWTFDCPCPWILVRKISDEKLTISVDDNPVAETRTMDILLKAGFGETAVTETVRVTQQAAAYVVPTPSAVSFGASGGQTTIAIDSNYDWDFTNSANWLTVTRKDNILTVEAPKYSQDQNRQGTIEIKAGDGKKNLANFPVSVIQIGQNASQMILVYKVTAAKTTITLPLAGSVDCSVNWGDTSVEDITHAAPTHTYDLAGEYTVTINGTVTALLSNAMKFLTEVRQWGQTGLKSMEKAFYNCASLVSIPTDDNNSFADVTTFASAFYGANLQEIPEGIFDHASKVTSFTAVFRGNTALKTIPASLFDKTPLVTNLDNAFYGCTGITAIPPSLFDNCPEVTTMVSTFSGTGIETIPAGLLDKLTKLTNINSLFSSATKLKAIPAGLLDNCAEITTMNGTFRSTAITEIPAELFKFNVKCNNMGYIFTTCPKLTTIPEGLFAPLTECTRFDYAFQGCAALEEIPDYLFSGFTKCTTYGSAFADCKALRAVPEHLFADVSSTGNLSFLKTFLNCSALTMVPARLFASADATTFESTFQGSGLTSAPAGLFSGKERVTTFAYVFDGCKSLKNIPADLFSGCVKTTTATYMFRNTPLESVPEGLFDSFPLVSSYAYTFYGCTSLRSVPTSLFDKSLAITDTGNLFNNCTELEGESPYTEIDGVKYHLYERTTANFTKAITSRTKCFWNCKKMSDYDDIPTTWK